jgi:hypothetical protein
VACSCEHGNESSSSVTGGKFLDQMSDYQLLNKKTVPLRVPDREEAM